MVGTTISAYAGRILTRKTRGEPKSKNKNRAN